MASSCAVQVKLELGHRAQVRKKPTVEGFTHDWMVFVRGPEHSNIQHFVEKVVFHLHDSFPRPKRELAGSGSHCSLQRTAARAGGNDGLVEKDPQV
ncbi:UNVERIFIED_CONTAM: Protein AF-9 [Gekko kuhli]